MSRCFRYPPPGYINGTKSSDEVLMELMKLRRESEKAKAERKKQKQREKRAREDQKQNAKKLKENVIQDGKYSPRSVVNSAGFFFETELDSDVEQMALMGGDDLTAEQALQLISSTIYKPNYYSSSDDSTGNSNKRRNIRPRCSAISSPFEKELQRLNLLYKELIGCWVPPAAVLKELTDIGDQDWLFGIRDHDRQTKKLKPSSSDLYSCRGSSTVPRAQYLPEADIYALPYTLPF